jgi:hypothetical protein
LARNEQQRLDRICAFVGATVTNDVDIRTAAAFVVYVAFRK